ncbi:MAG: pilus assembly protein N-terminal domain-containing protein [bacterium]
MRFQSKYGWMTLVIICAMFSTTISVNASKISGVEQKPLMSISQSFQRNTVALQLMQMLYKPVLTPTINAKNTVDRTSNLTIMPGESEVLKGRNITRTSVSDPTIVDIVPVSTSEILVNAKMVGVTTIRVWDAQGVATYKVTVTKPPLSPEELSADLEKQIGISTIFVKIAGDTIILSGTAPTNDDSSKAAKIAGTYSAKVLNLITVETVSVENFIASLKAALPNEDLTYEVLPDKTVYIHGTLVSIDKALQVQDVIRAWIGSPEPLPGAIQTNNNSTGSQEALPDSVDQNRTFARESQSGDVVVKDEFSFTRKVFGGRILNGPRVVVMLEINPALATQVLVNVQVIEINKGMLKQLGVEWSSFVGGIASPLFSLFEDREIVPSDEAGSFSRSGLSAQVTALVDDNAAKILSQPRILIADGHSANILVGGEFPIPMSQQAGEISIQFKTFGIQLAVRPKIMPGNRILLTLTPEVSSLDFANGIKTSSILIPAIRTRRATTTVHVMAGQTLIIGGLISSEDAKAVSKVPLLGDIPVIGELFKSTRFLKNETELVIMVTPTTVENSSTESVIKADK